MRNAFHPRHLWKYLLGISLILAGILLRPLALNAMGKNNAHQSLEIPLANASPTPKPITSQSMPILTESKPTSTEQASSADGSSPTATTQVPDPTEIVQLDPADWKAWPVLPIGVSDEMKELYQEGLEKGNNPHAFSILGDCHSLPDVFLGIYDRDPEAINLIKPTLQEIVDQFQGSFDRYSPTVALGATAGAILWYGWNENKEGYCLEGEIPIDCELRVHKPSIAFVHIGTHYETRNEYYLTIIIEKLIANRTVPIIVTKADNLELDERVNDSLAQLAVDYQLPVWNFWQSVQNLPNLGLNEENPMYLSDQAYEIHRQEGLEVLNLVYRALQER